MREGLVGDAREDIDQQSCFDFIMLSLFTRGSLYWILCQSQVYVRAHAIVHKPRHGMNEARVRPPICYSHGVLLLI